VSFAVAISVAGFAFGIQVPSPEQRVDPRTVADSGPWADPGLRELSPGKYEAYILAQTWSFLPREMTVPVDSEITFYITSKDVQHGFKLQETNLNVQVVPGQVSKLTITFDKPGDYDYICTEYCGSGHAAMFGTLHVEP
jgi:cytochrome c oxidase subunit 2